MQSWVEIQESCQEDILGKRGEAGKEGPRWWDEKANWIVINTEFLCFFGPWGLSPGLEVSNGLGLGSICSVKTSPGGSSSAKRHLRRRNLIRVRPVFPCLLPSVEILSSHPHLARARTQTHRHRHTRTRLQARTLLHSVFNKPAFKRTTPHVHDSHPP